MKRNQLNQEHEQDKFSMNLLSLTFKNGLIEKEFTDFYFESNLKIRRFSLLFVFAFFAILALWDSIIIESSRAISWGNVLFVVSAVFLLGYVLFFIKIEWYRKVWQPLFAFYVLLMGFSFTFIAALSQMNYIKYSFLGIIFCLLFCYALVELTFRWALGSGQFIIIIYILIMAISSDITTKELIIQVIYMLGINLLSIVVCYSQEKNFREKFIYHTLLKVERIKSLELNTLLEEKLMKSQKMEAVGQLTGGVAHDYNNISGVIIGYAELIKESIDKKSELSGYTDQILEAALRAKDITKQLLSFSRKNSTVSQVIDLNDSIETMLKILHKLIGENINLTWLPGENVWPAKMDPLQMDQILTTLIINAREAIDKTGLVILETGNYIRDCKEEFVYFSVSDDGKGMDGETVKKIFEPLFTTKKTGKETGAGLATVNSIVKQNKGFINVSSELGKGTSFQIFFPRHYQKVKQVRNKSIAEPEKGGKETLLLVEDDQNVLKLEKNVLESMGYKVIATAYPEKAEAIVNQLNCKIDLLLTDVIMPEINGNQLSELIKKKCPHIKTLFMSGYAADIITLQGILDEGVNFLSKPFTRKELAHKIRNVLDGSDLE